MKKKRPGRKPNEPDLSTWKGRVSSRLRDLRRRKFPTQDRFVDALRDNGLETSKSVVSQWETAKCLPNIYRLPMIAKALGIKVRSLLPDE